MQRKVRYEELLPHEMEEIMKGKPIAYLPFGTLEWHGLHLTLGNDTSYYMAV
jgi:creatinine amidohydrolase